MLSLQNIVLRTNKLRYGGLMCSRWPRDGVPVNCGCHEPAGEALLYLPASLSCFESVAAWNMLMPEAGHAQQTEDMISQLMCMMEELLRGLGHVWCSHWSCILLLLLRVHEQSCDWLCPWQTASCAQRLADKRRCALHRAQKGGNMPAAAHQEVARRGGDPAAGRLVCQAGALPSIVCYA